MNRKIHLGKQAESIAWKFFRKRNYKLLHKNYRTQLGEIDLIVQKNNWIVFVEVKALQEHSNFKPEDHFNYAKRKKQILLANAYLTRLKGDHNARIDLLTVVKKEDDFFIEHHENVIHDVKP